MNKQEIKGEIISPNKNLDTIKENFKNNEITSLVSLKAVSNALGVRRIMKEEKDRFMAEVNAQLENFNNYYKEVNDFIEIEVKDKALKFADKSLITTYKVKEEIVQSENFESTGEFEINHTIIEKEKHQLPSGFRYTPEKEILEFIEDKIIEDKYWKKTLKKTEVNNDIKLGKLNPNDIAVIKKSEASIAIVEEDLNKFIDKLKETERSKLEKENE